jgi:hypothetical protein
MGRYPRSRIIGVSNVDKSNILDIIQGYLAK